KRIVIIKVSNRIKEIVLNDLCIISLLWHFPMGFLNIKGSSYRYNIPNEKLCYEDLPFYNKKVKAKKELFFLGLYFFIYYSKLTFFIASSANSVFTMES